MRRGGSGGPAGLVCVGTDYVEGGRGVVFLLAVDDQWDRGESHVCCMRYNSGITYNAGEKDLVILQLPITGN